MDYIVVKGVPPYDGRYEFDLEQRPLITHEWGWVKRLAGYLPAELESKVLGDPELITVFAAIAVTRAGKAERSKMPQTFERLGSVPFEQAIEMESDAEEDDAGPPPTSTSSKPAASGGNSKPSSETSAPRPRPSGMPVSATSVSAPQRSGS